MSISAAHLKISVLSFDFLYFPQVEYAHPGFTYDLVMRLVTSIVTLPEYQIFIHPPFKVNKADLSVNMNESVLRLQGGVRNFFWVPWILNLKSTFLHR